MQQDASKTFGHQLSADFTAKYEITGILGEGGMGQVLRGRQVALGRDVAIKLLTLRSYATPERRQRFKDEAQRCAQMSHPNLVGVYDYGEEGERPYMVMELVDGESLADRLKREKRVPIKEALEIGIEICEGLHYAHEQGLVHRDIKSDNILLDKREKQVKVADFGIAIESDEGSDKDNVIIGTPSYMSPEQASGKKADHRSDIYSTGVILYEMLCGQVPFTGETSMAIIIKHLNERAGSMTDLNPEVPPQLEEIIQRALEKSPEHRYQQIRDLASRLKKATSLLGSWQAAAKDGRQTMSLSTSVTGAIKIATVVPETQEEKLRRYAGYAVAGTVVLAAFMALVYVAFLAPPTYEAKDFQEELGFTQAKLAYQTNHPCKTRLEYKESGTSEVKEFAGETETVRHEVFLEGLREDTRFSWRPLFPADQTGDWRDFTTRVLRFTDVTMAPRVNGARIAWKTSLPVEMEVEYLQGGSVKEIVHLEGVRTEHSFTASFANPAEPYQVRLKAILGGHFQSTHLIEQVPTINLKRTEELAAAIRDSLANEYEEFFPEDIAKRFERFHLRDQVQDFVKIKEIFYDDPQVPAETRMRLNLYLHHLWEFDLYLAYADREAANSFSTGAEGAFGPYYLASTQAPFRGGRSIELLATAKDMVFDPNPPPDPITGELPPDAKNNAKFSADVGDFKEASDAFLEIQVQDVAPNCYFRIDFGHSKRPTGFVYFYPPRSTVLGKSTWSGTYRARLDPRLIRARRDLQGWVRLKFLRNTVTNQKALQGVAGGFRGLSLSYKK